MGIQLTPGTDVYLDFTPTITQVATLTTSSLTSRYCQVGKRVHFWGKAVLSSAGTAGTGISLTLPVTPHASFGAGAIGVGRVSDTGTTMYSCICIHDGPAPGIVFQDARTAGETRVGASPSFAVASGDILWWDVVYEAA